MAGGPRFSNGDAEEHSSLSKQDREARGLDDLTSIDQKLVVYAGALTPEQIAEKTGIPAEEVAKRTLAVLNSVDYFTFQQMRAKSIVMLNVLIAEAMNRLSSVSDRNAGAFFNATGGNLQRIMKELGEMEKQAEKNSSAMEQAYAKRMVDIVSRAFDRYLGKLSVLYPDIDPREIAAGYHESILEIAREIDAEQ